MKDCNDPYAARAQRHLADGRKKFAPSLSDLARFDDPGADEVRKRLATVQHLLKEGRDAEAIPSPPSRHGRISRDATALSPRQTSIPTSQGTNITKGG